MWTDGPIVEEAGMVHALWFVVGQPIEARV